MSSKLQLDVRHLNRWWRHLVNAYKVRQAWCLLQVKLCDPCLSALKWFVYHARRYTSAWLFLVRMKQSWQGQVSNPMLSILFSFVPSITFNNLKFWTSQIPIIMFMWLRSTVGRTPVFGRRTDPVLRSACSWRVTTMWVNRPLQVSQLGQLSLSSFRGR